MNRLTDNNKNILNQCREIYSQFVFSGIKVRETFKTEEYNTTLVIRLNLFTRFVHRLESINILLEKLPGNPYHEESIGLLIRNGLTDFTSLLYLNTYIDQPEEIDIAATYFFDHVRQTIRHLLFMNRNSLFEDELGDQEEQYKKAVIHLKGIYTGLFNNNNIDFTNPNNNLIYKKFPKNEILQDRILSFPDLRVYRGLFDLYEYYSKYEHFGSWTNMFQTDDENNLFAMIMGGMSMIMDGANNTLSYINHHIPNPEFDLKLKIFRELYLKHYGLSQLIDRSI